MTYRGRIYYAKRVGLSWQVWWAYQDGSADPHSGSTEWQHSSLRHWRKLNAEREANNSWRAFNDGVFEARPVYISETQQ